MKNFLFLALSGFFLMAVAPAQAQQTDSVAATEAGGAQFKHSIYAEAFGNAIVGSLNYERFFADKKPDALIALRVGALVLPFGSEAGNFNYVLLVPVEVTRIHGKKAVKLEYGAGATLYFGSETYTSVDGSAENEKNVAVAPVLRIGGRWQIPQTPYFLRVGFTPLLISNDFWEIPVMPLAGVSVGYSFGSR